MSEAPKTPPRPGRVGLNDWLRLARAVTSACDVRKLLLAAVGLIFVQLGWSMIDPGAPAAVDVAGPIAASPNGIWIRDPGQLALREATEVLAPLRLLVEPSSRAFGPIDRVPFHLARLVWATVVLVTVGGAVARLAVVEAATGRRPTLGEALGVASRAAPSLIAAAMLPLAMAAALASSAAWVGRLLPGPLTPVSLVLVFLAFVFQGFMIAAWPFIPVVGAAEGERATEIVSRSFGYVGRRPMTVVACGIAGLALGTIALAAIRQFLLLVLYATNRAVGGGMLWDSGPTPWVGLLSLTCSAWAFAFFWSAAARAYLLLRQDVDDVAASDAAALR